MSIRTEEEVRAAKKHVMEMYRRNLEKDLSKLVMGLTVSQRGLLRSGLRLHRIIGQMQAYFFVTGDDSEIGELHIPDIDDSGMDEFFSSLKGEKE